ncbi:MAG: substrate-binding domain-containing protein [Acidobacteria bacterium]|nr:substrate-binding domain-containing protein [Acidobacteriota bacterium]
MILKRQVLARHLTAMLPLLSVGALFLYALWPWLPFSPRGAEPRTVIFYGFSILGEVMTEAIFPAFQESWHRRTGQSVELISAFAGSGTITNQLIMGVPADVALLSLELDARRLSDARVIPPQSWRRLPHRGVVNRTPFIILVRPGNSENIRDFADLARPGIQVVHPDPLTSGGANWALIAEYGAALRNNPAQPGAGQDLLLGIWRNVVAQAASARAARTQFENGFGDALITYEQEVLWDRARGRLQAEIVYPHSTILSEHTLVVIERNVEPQERELVDAFVAFLWSEPAQRLFVTYGFRSMNERLNEANPSFGKIADPFLIDDLGGWERAKREIVDGIWKNHVLKELGQ